MGGFPVLTVVTFLPLAGAILLLFIRREQENLIRLVSLAVTGVTLLIALALPLSFDFGNAEMQFVSYTNRGAPLSVGFNVRAGGFFSGDRVTLEPNIRYRIGETFNAELSWNYNDIDLKTPESEPFKINVGILKLAYSFTPKISLEALIQYDDRSNATAANFRFAWLQSASSGLYVVYNELQRDDDFGMREKGRELILKYSYIFDLL